MAEERFTIALAEITTVAESIRSGSEEPLKAAHRIYYIADDAGAWGDDAEGKLAEQCAGLGADFLQMGEGLEENQDDPKARAAWETLIKEAAEAHLNGLALPDYEVTSTGWPTMPHKP